MSESYCVNIIQSISLQVISPYEFKQTYLHLKNVQQIVQWLYCFKCIQQYVSIKEERDKNDRIEFKSLNQIKQHK